MCYSICLVSWSFKISGGLGHFLRLNFGANRSVISPFYSSANRIPECLAPGRFDFLLASHQIFHICVVLAALAHYQGVLTCLRFRMSQPYCGLQGTVPTQYNEILRTLFWFPDFCEHSLAVNHSENILVDSFYPPSQMSRSRGDDRIHINKFSWNSRIILKLGLDTLWLSIHDENSWDKPRSRFFFALPVLSPPPRTAHGVKK